jgi:NADPH:quinone reductase-like Zn-dependent oxidoreductase
VTVLGCDVAGKVEAVGADVTTLQPGDEVFGSPSCAGSARSPNPCASPADVLTPKPANLSFKQAAAVPLAALTALQGLRDQGRVEAGQTVLIIGASGGVGTFAVQIAKSLGAEVTGVCSTRNLDPVRSLGADHVIDYTHEDPIQGGQRYDVIFQVAGTRSPSDCRRALKPKGTLVSISGDSSGRWIGPVSRMLKARAVAIRQPASGQLHGEAEPRGPGLAQGAHRGRPGLTGGRPVYSLPAVPEAIRYLEERHARGKVVITL